MSLRASGPASLGRGASEERLDGDDAGLQKLVNEGGHVARERQLVLREPPLLLMTAEPKYFFEDDGAVFLIQPDDLADGGDAARAARKARDLYDHVNRRRDLLAHGSAR